MNFWNIVYMEIGYFFQFINVNYLGVVDKDNLGGKIVIC